MAQMAALTFEATEEVFSNSIVERVTFAGHTLEDTELIESLAVKQGGILNAAVGVEDEAGLRLAAVYGQVQCREGEICINAVRESITNDLLCAKVLDDGTIEPALIGGDVGDVADPSAIGFIEREASCEEIGSNGMCVP